MEEKKTETTEERIYSQLKEYVRAVATGKGYQNSLFVFGNGGLGKTKVVIDTLNELLGKEPIYYNNYSTIVELINFLYIHRADEIILLDDYDSLLNNPVAVSCLKGALWGVGKENKRLISYMTTSNKLTAPSQFEFTSKIIFLINEHKDRSENKSLNALFSRSISYTLEVNYTDLILLLEEISKKPYRDMEQAQKDEVFEFIKENTDETFDELSIRTLITGFDFYVDKNDKWKELLLPQLKENEKLALLKKFLEESATIREAQNKWSEQTGLSRRSFFYYHKKYKSGIALLHLDCTTKNP